MAEETQTGAVLSHLAWSHDEDENVGTARPSINVKRLSILVGEAAETSSQEDEVADDSYLAEDIENEGTNPSISIQRISDLNEKAVGKLSVRFSEISMPKDIGVFLPHGHEENGKTRCRTTVNTRGLSGLVETAARRNSKMQLVSRSSSLARLRLAHMRLHGREDDLKYLKSKLRTLSNHNNGSKVDESKRSSSNSSIARPPELVLISGVSGVGKSALVMRGLRDPAEKAGIAFAGGKFDLNNAAVPLKAFGDAMLSLTSHVMKQQCFDKIKEDIKEAFGVKDDVIVRAIPGLRVGLFPFTRTNSRRRESPLARTKEVIARQQYAIRTLLKIICNHLKGVVLFLDDLQWSDIATLDLLKSISLDSEIQSLLLVGAYREDEVKLSETHPLAILIQDLKEQINDFNIIKVGNLRPDSVKHLVAEALGMEGGDEDKVDTLSATIHNKTGGNAFFVLLFLKSLHEEELIKFSFSCMQWLWDDDGVKAKLVTDNIATAVIRKLKRFDQVQQNILKIASCLGAKFSISSVATVMDALFSKECGDTASLLSTSIGDLVGEGLLERNSMEHFRFSHDQVQSAAFELIPVDERNEFRGKIGTILWTKLTPDEIETNLFEIVSLRNCDMSSITSVEERNSMAKLNLQAGMKASENAAFDSASMYFKAGYELCSWDEDPSTMQKLCSEGACSCFINSDFEQMHVYADEVLSKDFIPMTQKNKVYEVKYQAALAKGNVSESVDLALDYHRKLEFSAPQNKPVSTFYIVKEYMKTTQLLKNLSPEDIKSLPEIKEDRIIIGQRNLSNLATTTYQAQPTLLPVIIMLMTRASIKHGIDASSCDSFAMFGMILCAGFGQMQRGREMGQASQLIVQKYQAKAMKSRVTFICESMINHWSSPLQGTLEPLLAGYKSGLESGDTVNASFNLTARVLCLFHSGRPLKKLQRELLTCINVLGQLNQLVMKMRALSILLAVRKLRGVDTVEEDEMDFQAIVKVAKETNNQFLHAYPMIAQMSLFVIFNNWKAASDILLEAGNVRASLAGIFCMVRFTFLEGLICLKVAQSATSWLPKRKWKSRGLKAMKLLRGWLKKGPNPNLVHIMCLLDAELAVLQGKKAKAEENFKRAIKIASNTGLLHDKALAHDLASQFFAIHGEDYWARHHMDSSRQSYSDWGATAKVSSFPNN